MIPPKIPDTRIHGSEAPESKSSADKGPGDHIVPMVEFVDGEGTGNEDRAQKRSVEEGEFPHGRMVVRPHLVDG